MDKIICVVGPTASGKTALAVRLAKALDGEVVSCDSMQIYRRMDVGTAKPAAEEMDGVPHVQEYPAHCLRLEYAVSPELPPDALQIRDAAPTDPPRLKIPDVASGAVPVGGAACIGIIGGEDGPTSVFVSGGAPSDRRVAYSSLHFAPPEQVTWQLRFSVVPRGEISEKLR